MKPRLVLVGNEDCRRIASWRAAAARLGWSPPLLVPYRDLLAGNTSLGEHLRKGDVVRFESAAQDWTTFRLLLRHGFEPALREGYPALGEREIDALAYERGRILHPRQAYLGFVRLLRSLSDSVAAHAVTALHHADDIAVQFDKPRCQKDLEKAGLPIPANHGEAGGFEEVRRVGRNRRRIMVKSAHGSGAAGCVALHWSGSRCRGLTTVEEVYAGGIVRLYCSKKIRRLDDENALAALIDRLCRDRVQVEDWLPKARWQGNDFDLRVVTIGGTARHMVMRTSRSVFTNLTLGSGKEEVAGLQAKVGSEHWNRLRKTCERVAAVYPRSFTLGIDVLMRPDLRSHAVLEVNGFGDLLVNLIHRGEDTHTATLSAWERSRVAA